MKILHLCSYYVGSLVYRNLFGKISGLDTFSIQYIFIPVRRLEHINKNQIKIEGVYLYYKKCLSLFTRISFLLKQKKIVSAFNGFLKQSPNITSCDVIHAHTLYSDGFLAYYLYKKYNVPYVVTVRTTDIGLFEKYLLQWKIITRRVLTNAKCVVFLSGQHRDSILRNYSNITMRSVVIPNGVDPFWIEHSILKKNNSVNSGKKAIYIGEINRNKNIKKAIHAFLNSQDGDNSIFIIIGGTYQDFEKIYGRLDIGILERVKFLGKSKNKEFIREQLLDSDVLIMPSHMESFGLVYLEAISQCTPVVYSVGQGLDGLFPEGVVGFRCNPKDSGSIKEAVGLALDRFPNGLDFKSTKHNPVVDFSWDKIASRLLDEVYG